MRAPVLAGLFALSALLLTLPARADVPPPGGETCTFEKVWEKDTACEACGAGHETPDACSTKYANTPFTKSCQTSGGTVWSEIWCKPDVGNPGQKTGCACGSIDGAGLLAFAALFRRRRETR